MLRIETVTPQSPALSQITALYERAFPANERRPLGPLLQDDSGSGDFIAFYDETVFCGFACLLTWQDITHLLYFAIDDTLRGRGYGTLALEAMRKSKPQNRFIADLEADDPAAGNHQQRQHRKQFYLRSGYTMSGITYRWRGERYEILVCGGTLTEQEFEAFWHYFEVNLEKLSHY